MSPRRSRAKAYLFIWLLALIGMGLAVFFILDAQYYGFLALRAGEAPGYEPAPVPGSPPGEFSRTNTTLRNSIVLVLTLERGTKKILGYGTGFIAHPGYVATNRHVVTAGDTQSSEALDVVVVDAQKRELPALGIDLASPEAGKESGDLALIRIDDVSIPPLYLMDSLPAENGQMSGLDLQTIGFGFDGTYNAVKNVQSMPLSKGVLSRFDPDLDLFVTSGLDARHGNSGGPVFVVRDGSVLGVVTAKSAEDRAGETTFVIPINRLKTLIREVCGSDRPAS